MPNTKEIQDKLAEIEARSSAVQQKRKNAASGALAKKPDKTSAINAEANRTSSTIRPLLREEALSHRFAQKATAQKCLQKLADEISRRYNQVIRVNLLIIDIGGDDIDCLLAMSDARWKSFLEEKRSAYGEKLVSESISLGEL